MVTIISTSEKPQNEGIASAGAKSSGEVGF